MDVFWKCKNKIAKMPSSATVLVFTQKKWRDGIICGTYYEAWDGKKLNKCYFCFAKLKTSYLSFRSNRGGKVIFLLIPSNSNILLLAC